MIGTPSSVSGSARSVRTVEHDRRAFLQVDCPSVSFDLACLGLHGPGSGVRSRFQVPHLQEPKTRGHALLVSWRSTFHVPGQYFVNVAIARGRHVAQVRDPKCPAIVILTPRCRRGARQGCRRKSQPRRPLRPTGRHSSTWLRYGLSFPWGQVNCWNFAIGVTCPSTTAPTSSPAGA
jgi:hypothetical protein